MTMMFLWIPCIVVLIQTAKSLAREPLASDAALVDVADPSGTLVHEEDSWGQKVHAVKMGNWKSHVSHTAMLAALLASLMVFMCYNIIFGRRRDIDKRRLSSADDSECVALHVETDLADISDSDGSAGSDSEETQCELVLESDQSIASDSEDVKDDRYIIQTHESNTGTDGSSVGRTASSVTRPSWLIQALCIPIYVIMIIIMIIAVWPSSSPSGGQLGQYGDNSTGFSINATPTVTTSTFGVVPATSSGKYASIGINSTSTSPQQ